jgi:acetolactate synthase I/II/III large subunit
VINESDCVIAFGAGLNKWTTAEGSLLAKKQVVQVDLQREAINQYSTISAGIIGDSSTVADTIVEWLDDAGVPSSGFVSSEFAERLAAYSDADENLMGVDQRGVDGVLALLEAG